MRFPCAKERMALWPNGYGVGLRNQRLQARVLPGSLAQSCLLPHCGKSVDDAWLDVRQSLINDLCHELSCPLVPKWPRGEASAPPSESPGSSHAWAQCIGEEAARGVLVWQLWTCHKPGLLLVLPHDG